MIYLDHAATTPVRPEVLGRMLPYFSDCYANASSSYTPSRQVRHALDQTRSAVAAALGAKRNEIYFTSGGTEADNWAIAGVVRAYPEKRHVITSSVEHHAVLNTCHALEAQGIDVTYLPVDALGRVCPEDVASAIRADTALVSVMLANNEHGTIEPIKQIARAAHEQGVLVHTDAVQAVGHIPVDVQALGVDLLSLSGHKFGGPKGAGALYVRDGVKLHNLIYGGAQERSMRAGTENTPCIIGMGHALDLAVKEMEEKGGKIASLRDSLEGLLLGIPGVTVNGDRANRLPGHLHVTIQDASSALLLMQLDMARICVSSGSACASGASERSHVMRAIGRTQENEADIRFSLGEMNTLDEINETARILRKLLKR